MSPIKTIATLAALSGSLFAGTYTAASCNRDDVNAVINGPTHTAVDGDVIQIPSGSCTWTSGVTVPVGIGITIKGVGTPDSSPGTVGPSASCMATVITDNSTSISPRNLFRFQPLTTSSTTRLSCMTMLVQSGLSDNSILPLVTIGGTCTADTCPQVRLDNITFNGTNGAFQGPVDGAALLVSDNVFGVMDHNSLVGVSPASRGITFLTYHNTAWQGIGLYGDKSWASAGTHGTSQTLYLENNYWGTGVVIGENEYDAVNGTRGGGRIAARFNTCHSCLAGLSTHGTESNGRGRGSRQMEFYGNNFICGNTSSGCQGALPLRSGVAYQFGNSLTIDPGAWWNNYLVFATYRTLQAFSPWGACDGTGPYDNNDGVVYVDSFVTSVSASGNTTTITDNTKSWSTDQWIPAGAPYALRNVTRNVGARITSNGTSTVSTEGWTSAPNFQVGDRYQILRATACIDQPNRSGGTLLSGATPSPTGAINQSIDPSYEWNDSGYNAVFGNVSSSDKAQLANRDWYTDNSLGNPQAQTSATSPFNGISGVGFGTLARRPTTCTTGVGYYATDQGSWNLSGNSFGQGNLYKCTGTDTWTLFYTPYTYPHPLLGISSSRHTGGRHTGGRQ